MPSNTPQNESTGHRALHAPWRQSYMDMLAKEAEGQTPASPDRNKKAPCFLREYWLNPAQDESNLVIVRTGNSAGAPDPDEPGGMILLNKFPYANGHLLVCLGASRGRLLDYDDAQRREFWSLIDLATDLCERTCGCQGVNIGVNQGLAAGAGVPEHLHAHVVPRWHGDVNFMTAVGKVRVIPGALEKMAGRYRETFANFTTS